MSEIIDRTKTFGLPAVGVVLNNVLTVKWHECIFEKTKLRPGYNHDRAKCQKHTAHVPRIILSTARDENLVTQNREILIYI